MDFILNINYSNDRFGGDEAIPQTISSGSETTYIGQWINGVFVYKKEEKKY